MKEKKERLVFKDIKFKKAEEQVAVKKESKAIAKVHKDVFKMSIVDLINDRKIGELAPSEIKRRKIEQEKKKIKTKDEETDEVKTETKIEVKEEPQRNRIEIINGKPQLVKPSFSSNPENQAKHGHKRVIEHDQQNMKLSSLNYLKASKAIRWN